ncbi:MAG: alanine--glyoxylate aminotransferase family protein, partial [Bacillota bacterium]|nr:alanine--glyoxylate aminotransferase family protein [Bacillota bacterium]
RGALSTYGLKPLASEDVAASTLSCILYPDGVDDVAFRKALGAKGMVVAGSLASLAGKAFRIGHMGNVQLADLRKAMGLIGEALQEQGLTVDIPAALAKFDSFHK